MDIAFFQRAARGSTNRSPHPRPPFWGLRYMLDEKEKLTRKVDAGFGSGTSGIHFDIREAF